MRKAFLTLAFVALVAGAVLAQRGGRGGMMGPIDSATLLSNKGVQEELKFTDDQKKDVKAAQDARQKAFAKAREDMDFSAFGKIQEDFTKGMKKVQDSLNSVQKKRLMQIEVQLAARNKNARIFANPEVVSALKLNDKQQKTVKSTLSDLEKDTKELMDDAKGDFQKRFQAMRKAGEMNQEAYATITKTFSEDQNKAFKDLGGKAFDYKPEFGGFGGGRGKGKGKKKDDF
jgi:hypothetical protein